MSAGIQRRPLPGITTLIEKFPLILFFALLIWLSLQSPFFLSWQNISMMLVQSVPLAILCFGLVCVIAVGGDDVVSGGIDLSLPAIAVLGVALLSLGMAEWNTPYLALLLLLIAVKRPAAPSTPRWCWRRACRRCWRPCQLRWPSPA